MMGDEVTNEILKRCYETQAYPRCTRLSFTHITDNSYRPIEIFYYKKLDLFAKCWSYSMKYAGICVHLPLSMQFHTVGKPFWNQVLRPLICILHLCPPLNLFNMTLSLSMLTFVLSSKSAQSLGYMGVRTSIIACRPTWQVNHSARKEIVSPPMVTQGFLPF